MSISLKIFVAQQKQACVCVCVCVFPCKIRTLPGQDYAFIWTIEWNNIAIKCSFVKYSLVDTVPSAVSGIDKDLTEHFLTLFV